jgi:Cof subfamily protein (haloacid dehalogenase superfamily)
MIGIIALDIDGTITDAHHEIPGPVVTYLSQLVLDGWSIVLITGRSFRSCIPLLNSLQFQYHLFIQNGATLLEMPSKQIVSKKYLDGSVFPIMEEICEGEPTDFVLFSGFDQQDQCYYRPNKFDDWLLLQLNDRTRKIRETWIVLDSFKEIPVQEFASLKCFGHEPSLKRIIEKMEAKLDLHVPLIRDPFSPPGNFVAQATRADVNKGEALLDFIRRQASKCPVIAAGDDNNDTSMLEVADFKVVMETAPKSLLARADFIAPSAADLGIIKGLSVAIEYVKGSYQ